MVTCRMCANNFRVITHKHLKKHKMTVDQYLKKFNLDKIDLVSTQTSRLLSSKLKGTKIGIDNPAKRKEVKEKISNTVKRRWDDGSYKNRINGMLGVCGADHANWKLENHTSLYIAENDYIRLLSEFQDISKCSRCNKIDARINIHHIDEDHKNFLPSNLEPLCIPCHTHFHYSNRKGPFLQIGRFFSFAAAHHLPYYDGKCQNLHGHEWRLEVVVRKRVDKKTGMVMDFSDLKKVVNSAIIDVFDHGYLNDYIDNPTAENILIYCWEKLMLEAHLKGIEKILVWESPDSIATLDKGGMLSIFSTNIEKYFNPSL